MIIITGAAGFIGSCLASDFNKKGRSDLILVDDFSKPGKEENWKNLKCIARIDRNDFLKQLDQYSPEAIFHLGARTDTTEFDQRIFDLLNVQYTTSLWNFATQNQIPFIYASSAATYGNGDQGFDDDPSKISTLLPMNPYGQSKHQFDLWAMEQNETPPHWIGLKFFNVFGPNEYHKGRMASVVFHTFNQIRETGEMKLFESHRPEFKNGEQSRDFIYVKDVVDVMHFWHKHGKDSGIYNLGTGAARSFNDLASAVFKAMDLEPKISYKPTPEDIRDTYQYYTQAEMSRTLSAGYSGTFTTLEDAVNDYVKNYLLTGKYF
ncbi:MAG: ADP-glyceromanno-heptose 6-epimerase [Bacteroidetes bacterium]|nr:ADP-glyceromanno-heptose 6-epimerase [Bacteroidota bacterium]